VKHGIDLASACTPPVKRLAVERRAQLALCFSALVEQIFVPGGVFADVKHWQQAFPKSNA